MYENQHIRKEIEILVFDFAGQGSPEGKYEANEGNKGKYYIDTLGWVFYQCTDELGPFIWMEYGKSYDQHVITNDELEGDQFSLTESLCSDEELRFGSCEPSQVYFKAHGIAVPLKGKWLAISQYLEGDKDNPFHIGTYKVDSDAPTADRMAREVRAYDSLYGVLGMDMSKWYNSLTFGMTLKGFRDKFFSYVGIQQEETELVNDWIIVEKTIEPEQISGKDIISAICEINGCFGHTGRDGRFQYMTLKPIMPGLYPSETLYPSGRLYPRDVNAEKFTASRYISCKYEDYKVKNITKIQIRKEEDDAGMVYPYEEVTENDNLYVIQDNFLAYGKGDSVLRDIASRLFDAISKISYRPFSAECPGNPCRGLGDIVSFQTKERIVESYILGRELKGVQGMRDMYSAQGRESYGGEANSIGRSIIELKGKTNTLERDAEHTKQTISDVETGLKSEIEQAAKSIRLSIEQDEGGESASFELYIDDDNGSHAELSAGTIGFSGLVSFKNLENEGETKINGGNIEAKTLSCDSLNGGEINGQKIVGGQVSGSKVAAEEGLFIQHTNEAARPPKPSWYKFLEAGGDSLPYFNILAPGNPVDPGDFESVKEGKVAISIGMLGYGENQDKMKYRETPYFPNGALIDDAYINSLHQTYHESGTTVIETGSNAVNGLKYRVRKSGAFVAFYGTYMAYLQEKNGESSFIISDNVGFLPTHHSPRTVGYAGGRVFIFQLAPEGKVHVWNTGERLDRSDALSVNYRFDYFIF